MDRVCDVLLVNPPYVTVTSVYGVGHQVPLGLLMVGGALLDAGFSVGFLDAESGRMRVEEVVKEVKRRGATVVMTGHAGSTPGHGTCVAMLKAIKRGCPGVVTVYGGPFPTYHAGEILLGEGVAGLEGASRGAVDVVVRGEGEATAVALVRALMNKEGLARVEGLAFLQVGEDGRGGRVVVTPERAPLAMDDFRIGWELLDDEDAWDRHHCFGLGRAVIVQLSRGCPHACTYCGQRGFWMKWRHRDPVGLADEIEWLARARGVRFVTLADENPTTVREVWETFLAEVARRKLPVKFFATIRATDIVRDKASLGLWKEAGIAYVLMGIDGTDEATLRAIKKKSTTRVDLEACRLLRRHGIFSMAGHIVGLAHERAGDFWRVWKQVRLYDPDFLNVMYITPHAWTGFAEEAREREVVDEGLAHWNYRRPVLGQTHLRAWQTFGLAKVLELAFHLRPGRLWRMVRAGAFSRQQMVWTGWHMGRVWGMEVVQFLKEWPQARGRRVGAFWGRRVGECRHEERVVGLRVVRKGVSAGTS